MSFETDELKLYVRYKREGRGALTDEERAALRSAMQREGRTPRIKGLNGTATLTAPVTLAPAKIPTEAIPILQPLAPTGTSVGITKFLSELEESGSLEQYKKDYKIPEEAVQEAKRIGEETGLLIGFSPAAKLAPTALIRPTFGQGALEEMKNDTEVLFIHPEDMTAGNLRKRAEVQKQQLVEKVIAGGLKSAPEEISKELQVPLRQAEEIATIQGRILTSIPVGIATSPLGLGADIAVTSAYVGAFEAPTESEIENAGKSSLRPKGVDPELWARVQNAGVTAAFMKTGAEGIKYIGKAFKIWKTANKFRAEDKVRAWTQKNVRERKAALAEEVAKNKGKFGEFAERERNLNLIAEHKANRPKEIIIEADVDGSLQAEIAPVVPETPAPVIPPPKVEVKPPEVRPHTVKNSLPKVVSWLDSPAGRTALEYGDEGTLAAAKEANRIAFEAGDNETVGKLKELVDGATAAQGVEQAVVANIADVTEKLAAKIQGVLPSTSTQDIKNITQLFRAVGEGLQRNGKITNAAEWIDDIGIEAGKHDPGSLNAYTRFMDNGKAAIIAYKGADASTFIHELGHIIRRQLNYDDLAPLEEFVGVPRGAQTWTLEAEEKFAKAFEQYLHDGRAPTKQLESVFKKIAAIMRETYRSIKGGVLGEKLPSNIRKVFDDIFDAPKIDPAKMKLETPVGPKVVPQRARTGQGTILSQALADVDESPIAVRIGKSKGRPIGQAITEDSPRLINSIFQEWTDRVFAVKRLAKDVGKDLPYIKTRLLTKVDAATKNAIDVGIFEPGKRGRLTTEGLKPLILRVGKKYKKFTQYMANQRGIEKLQQDIEVGATLDQMMGFVATQERKNPEFRETAKKIREWIDVANIKEAFDSGLLSADDVANMRAKNQFYLPARRAFDETFAEKGGMFKNGSGTGFRAMKGSDRPWDDPFYHLIQNTYAIRNKAARNRNVLNILDELAIAEQANPGVMEKWARRVTEDVVVGGKKVARPVVPAYDDAKLKEVLKKIVGVDAADEVDKMTPAQLQLLAKWTAPPQGMGKNQMVVYRNGKGELWEFDEWLYRAIGENDGGGNLHKLIGRSWVFAPFRWTTSAIRSTATQLNIGFAPYNFARDQSSAALFSKYGYVPYIDGVKGMFVLMKDKLGIEDEVWEAYKRLGGGQSAVYNADRNTFRETYGFLPADEKAEFVRSVIIPGKKVVETLEGWNNFFETATRLGEFRLGYKQAKTEDDLLKAFFSAQEVTLDFSKGGDLAREFNKIEAFFNAGILGTMRMAQAMRERPVQTMLKGLTYITLPTIGLQLNILRNPKWTEAYFNLHEMDRDLFYFVPYDKEGGRTGFWRIPKGYGAQLAFSVPYEKLIQHIATKQPDLLTGGQEIIPGETTRELKQFVKNPFSSVLWQEVFGFGIEGAGSAIPDLARPLLETYVNYDLWRQLPIEPYYMRKNYVGSERKRLGQTSTLSQEIADFLGNKFPMENVDISPLQIDHIIKSYFTSYGNAGLKYIDMMAYTFGDRAVPPDPWWSEGGWHKAAPFIGRFMRDEEVRLNQSIVSRYYDKSQKFTKLYNSLLQRAGYESGATEGTKRREPTEEDQRWIESHIKNNQELLFGFKGLLKFDETGKITAESMEKAARLAKYRYLEFNKIEKSMSEARGYLDALYTDYDPEGHKIPEEIVRKSLTPERKAEVGLKIIRPILKQLKEFEINEDKIRRAIEEPK